MHYWGWKVNKIERAEKLRKRIENVEKASQRLVYLSDITAEEMDSLISIYDTWEELLNTEHKQGKLFVHEGQLYEVRQLHTFASQWIPGTVGTEALYLKATPKTTEGGKEVVAPWQEGKIYGAGEKCTDGGFTWQSVINNNVWAPTSPGMDERYWIKVK